MADSTTSTDSDSYDYYAYDPSMVAAVIFIVLFGAVSLLHTYQLFRTRTWYFIPFLIGGYFQTVGYVGRALNADQTPDWTLGPFIIQAILLLVAPALYAASIYMELGRIIALTEGESYSLIRLKWLTKIFVGGDILSFLVQAAGAGIMAGGSASSGETGNNIVIAGLVIQVIYFSFFIAIGAVFHSRMRRNPTSKVYTNSSGVGIWKKHLITLYFGSLLILIRSVFRLIEYAQGHTGYLISHEVYLYLFDAVLMFAVMVLFAVVHPSEVNAMLKGGRAKALRKIVSVYQMT